jgi:hypothetical protein
MVNERRWLILIFSLYILLAFGYSVLLPPWEAPDEPAHFHLAWRVARNKSYPTYEENYEAYQPRAYYYTASLVIRALDKFDPQFSSYYLPAHEPRNLRKPTAMFFWTKENYRLLLGVYSLRWVNTLIGALALWLNWKSFRLLAPDQPGLRLAALALNALTPQYLHIMSAVNNDASGTFAGTLLFYLAMRFTKEPANRLALVCIPLALLLPFITKLTVLPVSAGLLLIVAWKWFFSLRSKTWIVRSGVAVVLGAGAFYLLFPETLQTAWDEINWRLFSLRRNALTSRYLKAITSQVLWTYWGKVGWIAVGLHYYIVSILTALGLVGLLLHAYRLVRSKMREPQFPLWLGTWVIALFTLLAVSRNALSTSATQGRFLFPAIGALSILMVGGLYSILPGRVRHHLPWIVTVLMVSCTLVFWQFGILPAYYQPFLE